MSHNTHWSKEEQEELMCLFDRQGFLFSACAILLNRVFGNNRTESACRTMYQKLKEK